MLCIVSICMKKFDSVRLTFLYVSTSAIQKYPYSLPERAIKGEISPPLNIMGLYGFS